jgi:hypothetical protein
LEPFGLAGILSQDSFTKRPEEEVDADLPNLLQGELRSVILHNTFTINTNLDRVA